MARTGLSFVCPKADPRKGCVTRSRRAGRINQPPNAEQLIAALTARRPEIDDERGDIALCQGTLTVRCRGLGHLRAIEQGRGDLHANGFHLFDQLRLRASHQEHGQAQEPQDRHQSMAHGQSPFECWIGL